jgi:hypothetical protein
MKDILLNNHTRSISEFAFNFFLGLGSREGRD